MAETRTKRNTPNDEGPRLDVLVAGAGYVGLASAVSIRQARPNLKVAVVDAAPAGVWERDTRASAIAAAASRMLGQLGCWDEIAPEAQAITEMIVTDSRTTDPVRPVFLTFDGEVAPGEPFAHMVANKVLNKALRRRAAELDIDIIEGVAVQAFERGPAAMTIHLADGIVVNARLLVAADGVNSKLRAMAGIKTVDIDYGQSGIVCTVAARAAAQRPRRGAFPAGRSVRHPAAHRRPLVDRLDRAHRRRQPACRFRRPGVRDGAGAALRPEARRDPRRGQAPRLAARPQAGARLRGAAPGAGRRRRARHPPDRRPGTEPRLQGCRGPCRDDRRGRPAGPGHRRDRRPANATNAGGASTRCRWASPPTY